MLCRTGMTIAIMFCFVSLYSDAEAQKRKVSIVSLASLHYYCKGRLQMVHRLQRVTYIQVDDCSLSKGNDGKATS